jgi:hypothetical protein
VIRTLLLVWALLLIARRSILLGLLIRRLVLDRWLSLIRSWAGWEGWLTLVAWEGRTGESGPGWCWGLEGRRTGWWTRGGTLRWLRGDGGDEGEEEGVREVHFGLCWSGLCE